MIGTAQFGMDYGISNDHGITSQNELIKILDFCKKENINSFDTARGYGKSESRLGNYFNNHSSHPWNITTKVTCSESLKNQFKKSKRNLGLIPNIILAHRPTDYLNKSFRNSLFSLKEYHHDLKVGVSVYSIDEVSKILDTKMPEVLQIPINILDTKFFNSGLLKKLHDYNIEIQARSIFLQGLLYLPNEVIKAKKTFQKFKWPVIDVTRKSVEETAASIIKIHEIYSNNVK